MPRPFRPHHLDDGSNKLLLCRLTLQRPFPAPPDSMCIVHMLVGYGHVKERIVQCVHSGLVA
jgi:hypothetical protein